MLGNNLNSSAYLSFFFDSIVFFQTSSPFERPKNYVKTSKRQRKKNFKSHREPNGEKRTARTANHDDKKDVLMEPSKDLLILKPTGQ